MPGRQPNPAPTEKGLEVYRYLIWHIEKYGYQPTRQEMADHFGVQINAIAERLKGLSERGFIDLGDTRKERGIRLVDIRFYGYDVSSPPKWLPKELRQT